MHPECKRLFLLALFSFPLLSCSHAPTQVDAAVANAIPVRATHAVSQDVPLEIAAVGNVEAINSVEIKSRIAGQIKSVAFEEGQNVTKGQLLFSIDRDTTERQMREQQAELERDIALEKQAQAVVSRDMASQRQSQSEAEIATKLEALGVISGQRAHQLLTTGNTASASLRSDEAAAEAASGVTKADKARLAQTELQLNFTNITSPISARAGAVAVKAGNMVRENDTTLVTLMQLAPIYVSFGVPEQGLAEIQSLNIHGQLAVEAESSSGQSLEGRLAFIDNTVDATTGAIRLKAVFPNVDQALWPGQFVNVRLRLRIEKDQIVVPASAIQNGLDGKYVWLVRSDVATIAPVTVLRTFQSQRGFAQAVIGNGIKPGDMVVTEGQLRLTTGARISLLSTPPAFAQGS